MESNEDIFKTICRVCLKYGNSQNMVSLIDVNIQGGLSCYGKAVLNFSNISLTKQDYLPAVMCEKCLYFLKQAIYFKQLSESSDKCLQNLVNMVGNSIEKIKEKIVEYTMFRFYFPEKYSNSSKNIKENSKPTNKESFAFESSLLIDQNVLLSTENIRNNFEPFEDHSNSDQNENTDYGDEILNKMQSLIDSNIPCSITVSRSISRKHLKLKKKLIKRKKILVMKDSNIQRKIKNLVCNICKKVLANQLTYEYHMQRHNGCRFICEHCGKGFPVQTELKIHQVSRHGTGPHLQCSHCPFKAPRKFELTEHERLHSGERPYACEKCGLTFRRRAIWRKHLIYHTEKNVQCPQCPRKFFRRSEMLAHANNIHDRIYVYLCNKCGVTYARTASVRRHLTERHGVPREMQGKIIRINKRVGYQEQ